MVIFFKISFKSVKCYSQTNISKLFCIEKDEGKEEREEKG